METDVDFCFRILPLILLVLVLSFYELKTGIIPDTAVLPAAFYALGSGFMIGPRHPIGYLLLPIGTVVLFMLLNSALLRLTGGGQIFGYGMVKLLAVVTGCLGWPSASLYLLYFCLAVMAASALMWVSRRSAPIPGSILVLVTLLLFLATHSVQTSMLGP